MSHNPLIALASSIIGYHYCGTFSFRDIIQSFQQSHNCCACFTDTDLFQQQQANPFADQSDPFGTHSDPFGHQSDPFAQQEDPFAPSAVEEPVAASPETAESTTVREGSQSEQPRGSQSEDLRRGSEIDDDLIEDIECHHGIPIKEQLELEQGSQEEEPDLLKESDSWDDIQGLLSVSVLQ